MTNKITEPFGFTGGKLLQELLEKEPSGITGLEKDILKARKTYLTEEQIEKFGLNEPEPIKEIAEEIAEETEAPKKTTAKRGRPLKK